MIGGFNRGTEKTCPSCERKSITCLGRIGNSPGVIYLTSPGNLYQCEYCSLYFRRPYLSLFELEQQYAKIPDLFWVEENRQDYNIVASFISTNIPFGKILDVGCFKGDFLGRLPDTYSKYGVELAESARKIAQRRGVTLIGSSIDSIVIEQPMFHVITLIDVIEHLPYPLKSLQRLANLLLPDGIIIISTGNTDALPWRLMRLDYWYYFTEHVSFFNPQWFQWAAQQLGLRLVVFRKFSHLEGSAFERWRQFAQCLTFVALKRLDRYPLIRKALSTIYPFNKAIHWTAPPSAQLWKDHQLVVLQLAQLS